MATTDTQCASRVPSKVFSHFAYGDPLPIYARYIGEGDNAVREDEAITVFIRCEREAGHTGKHLARDTIGWSDDS